MSLEESIDVVIKTLEGHQETFDEIVELTFTDEMKKKTYSDFQRMTLIGNFFNLKKKCIEKRGRFMTFPETFVWYRLTNKFMGVVEPVEKTLDTITKDEKIDAIQILNG